MEKKQNYFRRFLSFLKDTFFVGLRKLLPFILFAIILCWVFGLLFQGIGLIEKLFPQSTVYALNLPRSVINIIEVLIICILILVIGIVSKQPKMSRKFEKWLTPIIYRIPLLSHLSKVSNQVTIPLKDSKFFKSVVWIETIPGGYEMGFLTGEVPEDICEELEVEKLEPVAMPFFPYTSARLLFVDKKKVKPSRMTVQQAIAFFGTLTAAHMTKKTEESQTETVKQTNTDKCEIKESHSDSEGDFF